jgi:hypothetical protein
MSAALVIQQARAHAPYYIVIRGLSGSTAIFHITSETAKI